MLKKLNGEGAIFTSQKIFGELRVLKTNELINKRKEEMKERVYFEEVEALSHFFADNEAVIFNAGFTTSI